eukprot:EG_transcript_2073
MLPWRATARPLPLRPAGPPGTQWAARPAAAAALRDPRDPLASPTKAPLLSLVTPPEPPLEAAPKHPTTSSWETVGKPISWTAKIPKGEPSHAVIEMLDLEQPEPPTSRDETPTPDDEARQMAQAVGAKELYDAYRARFAAGAAPVDQLPELLAAAGLTVPPEQVEAAMEVLCPQVSPGGGLPYEQCQELFLHLRQHQRKEDQVEEARAKLGRFARWLATLSDRGTAHLLLAIVVLLVFVGGLFEGGLAILLVSLDDTTTVKSNLQESLAVVQDSLDVYGTQIAAKEVSDRATLFVATMSSVLQSVAFASTVSANAAQISRVLVSISNGYAAWLNYEPQPAAVGLAAMTARLADASAAQYGRTATGGLVDEMNARLPDDVSLLLGQWRANSTSTVQYLTQLPNASQCAAGACTGSAAADPMRAALAGATSATWGVDYSGAKVYAGYSGVNGLGVQVDLMPVAFFRARIQAIQVYLDAWTADPTNSWEYMLGYIPSPGVRVMSSTLPGCDAACQAGIVADGMPLARALNGETGTTTYINFRGVKSVVSYAPIPNAPIPMGLAIHNAYSDILVTVLTAATALVNNVNTKFPYRSEEFELVQFETEGNATNFSHLSAYRLGDECPAGHCIPATEYAKQAAANCSLGVSFSRSNDYRGKAVLVGSTCSADLGVVLSFKVDQGDMDANTLSAIVEAVNSFNAADSEDSMEFLVAKPKAGLTAAQVTGYGDFDVVSQLKYPNQCARPNCTVNRESALRALEDWKAVIDTRDYRNMDVLAASSRSAAVSYGIGVAVEQDHSDAFQPTVDTIIKVAAFTWGVVLAGTLTQVAIMQYFLRAMVRAKAEGQRVLVAEKERFSTMVASMYPQYVVPQLLEGQKQMVCEVPGAAVFFSDIHEFTSASNTMGSAELLQLMGYVYGVMDHIADRFRVYKVKTIGDGSWGPPARCAAFRPAALRVVRVPGVRGPLRAPDGGPGAGRHEQRHAVER